MRKQQVVLLASVPLLFLVSRIELPEEARPLLDGPRRDNWIDAARAVPQPRIEDRFMRDQRKEQIVCRASQKLSKADVYRCTRRY